ncbi:hypothetical protein CDV31_013572 [Fusarium ambrosium]|uniref:Fungal N-terminal domain-containing protein n=1 Tax=Fusarium ambrosium TaxID=131363 RepID=A0A428T2A2_9HYPO|nr:hypothetical protein CDV31_013572 [Fusarium ambrosium]
MSDPFSVAGTAVGITSLGIDVCKGLIHYLRSIRGQNKETAEDLSMVQTLLPVFYSLHDILSADQNSELTGIRQCLQQSQDKLQELQQLLLELRGPLSFMGSKTTVKMAKVSRSLAYPFHEGKLLSLRQSLHALIGNLNLALSVSSLKQRTGCVSTVETTKALAEAGSQAQVNALQHLQHTVQQSSALINKSITNGAEETRKTQWMIRDLGQNLIANLTLVEAETQLREAQLQRIEDMLKGRDLHASLANRMDIRVQTIPDESDQRLPTPNANLNPEVTTFTSPFCDCATEKETHKCSVGFGNIRFQFDQNRLRHRRDCLFYGINKNAEQAITARFPLRLAWFCARITMASLQFRRGTNGLSMSIQYHNIVPQSQSPVHKVWRKLRQSIFRWKSCEAVVQELESTQRHILSLYRDGESSPRDLDEGGRNHSEMVINSLTGMTGVNRRPRTDRLCADRRVFSTAMKVLRTIFTAVGDDSVRTKLALGLSDPTCSNIHPRKTEFLEWLVSMFEVDSADYIKSFVFPSPSDHCFTRVPFPALMAAMDTPPIGRAILSRSLIDLEACISKNPRSVAQRVHGFTALQLSATWPRGLQRLLNTEAEEQIEDCGSPNNVAQDYTPFIWAVYYSCADSVDLLLARGCDPKLDWDWNRLVYLIPDDVVSIIAFHISERRKKLLLYGQENLDRRRYPDTPNPTDTDAASLCKALMSASVAIPQALQVDESYTSIYHCRIFSMFHFPVLFERGFRDHKTRNDIGLTPVMAHSDRYHDGPWRLPPLLDTDSKRLHGLLEWLWRKGFLNQRAKDPNSIGINTHATGWHYLAAKFNWGLHDDVYWLTRRNVVTPVEVIEKISKVKVRYNCSCLCTRDGQGCSPLQSLMKTYADQHSSSYFNHPKWNLELFMMCWRHILLHCKSNSGTAFEQRDALDLFMDFVRFVTFEALGLTHTCCVLRLIRWTKAGPTRSFQWDIVPPPWIPDSSASNQACVLLNHGTHETTDTAANKSKGGNRELFENLIVEFDQELRRLSLSVESFEEFLWGSWRQRISIVFAVEQSYLDELRQSLIKVHVAGLPKRAQSFLSPSFDLIKYVVTTTKEGLVEYHERDGDDGAALKRNAGVLSDCIWCPDGQRGSL